MDVGLVVGVQAQVHQEAPRRVWKAVHLGGESVTEEHDEAVVCHAGSAVFCLDPGGLSGPVCAVLISEYDEPASWDPEEAAQGAGFVLLGLEAGRNRVESEEGPKVGGANPSGLATADRHGW